MFHAAERELLEGVIRFADRPLRNVMMPRHAIAWLDVDDPLDDILAEILETGHSRFPLARATSTRSSASSTSRTCSSSR